MRLCTSKRGFNFLIFFLIFNYYCFLSIFQVSGVFLDSALFWGFSADSYMGTFFFSLGQPCVEKFLPVTLSLITFSLILVVRKKLRMVQRVGSDGLRRLLRPH